MDTWEMVDAERTDLADLTDSLTPEQWDAPTLCTAWKVRDVVAHVTEGATLTTGKTIAVVAKYGFRINKMLNDEAIKRGAAPIEALRSDWRATVGVQRTPPGVKPAGLLADEVIHQQDIRRALGAPRQIPEDRLRVVLDETAKTSASFLPAKKRINGLHLRATDLDWEAGTADGPEVAGPGEALLMAMAGRPAALDDLSGPGVDALRARIGG
jgi:uncharacterized protein (TIGR03083 family)